MQDDNRDPPHDGRPPVVAVPTDWPYERDSIFLDPTLPTIDWRAYSPDRFRGCEESYIEKMIGLLHPQSFLRNWVRYMAGNSDSHAGYSVYYGLALASVCIPATVTFPSGDQLAANFFTMVLGPSHNSRKSHGLKVSGKQVLLEVSKEHYIAIPGSAEWLTDRVIDRPRALLVVEEGQIFFSITSRTSGSHMDRMRGKMIEMADATPQQRATVDKERNAKLAAKNGKSSRSGQDDPDRIEAEPRLSMAIASAPEHLTDFTVLSDWTGGFVPRYALIYAERRRFFRDARMDKPFLDALRARVSRMIRTVAMGPCEWVDPDAQDFLDAWHSALPDRKHDTEHTAFLVGNSSGAAAPPKTIRALIDRAVNHARKAAMIAAFDEHVTKALCEGEGAADMLMGRPWGISMRHVMFGCAVAGISIASGWKVISDVVNNNHQREWKKILRLLEEGHGAARVSDIYKAVGQPKRATDEYIATLIAMGSLGGLENNVVYLPNSKEHPLVSTSLAQMESDWNFRTGAPTLALPSPGMTKIFGGSDSQH